MQVAMRRGEIRIFSSISHGMLRKFGTKEGSIMSRASPVKHCFVLIVAIPRPGTGRRPSLRANAGPFDFPIRTERDSALQCTLFKFHLVAVSASGTDSLERYRLN